MTSSGFHLMRMLVVVVAVALVSLALLSFGDGSASADHGTFKPGHPIKLYNDWDAGTHPDPDLWGLERDGTAESGTPTTLTDDTLIGPPANKKGAFYPDDRLIGATITITAGAGINQTRTITDNTADTVWVSALEPWDPPLGVIRNTRPTAPRT